MLIVIFLGTFTTDGFIKSENIATSLNLRAVSLRQKKRELGKALCSL